MKAALRLGILPFLLFVMVIMCAPDEAEAQNDYPVPPGNPSTWGIPGKPDTFVPKERQTSAPDEVLAPSQPGNEQLDEPSVPAGDAQEKYTGTRDRGFDGVAGTGIDQSGVEQKR
jgi:hypothetical protein